MPPHLPTRRDLLRTAALGTAGTAFSGWLGDLALRAVESPQRKRACILLWMAGGPSQTDTFDMKPGHANGGPFREIATPVPGLRFSEHLPRLAAQAGRLAVVRSMQTREGDHGRATAHLRTGYTPQGSIRFPSLGAVVAHELANPHADLPGFVSVTPQGAFAQPSVAAGFLGPRHAPLVVNVSEGGLKVEDLGAAVSADRACERLELLREMEAPFLHSRPGQGTATHVTAYDRAVRLQRQAAARAFDLGQEPDSLREKYGRSLFGQGCLLARRLVERGVPFVEVTLGGWDTHDNNFEQVKDLCAVVDPAWSALLDDLGQRGLLDSTLVVWMGEFGRTPGINPRNGRDHYPAAWSTVLGGGGIRGGSVVGRTSKSGLAVEDRPVKAADLIATICLALGLDPKKQNLSNVDRPIRLADPDAEPLREVLR
ncbi:MAG TPA: DUF1501 domain-containing protein [Gemmataceae bacterium]|nr:DUF1501 domain-containing protein [Gemmataceae bacterium]